MTTPQPAGRQQAQRPTARPQRALQAASGAAAARRPAPGPSVAQAPLASARRAHEPKAQTLASTSPPLLPLAMPQDHLRAVFAHLGSGLERESRARVLDRSLDGSLDRSLDGSLNHLLALCAVFLLRYAGLPEGSLKVSLGSPATGQAAALAQLSLALGDNASLAQVHQQLAPHWLAQPAPPGWAASAGLTLAVAEASTPTLLYLRHQAGRWRLSLASSSADATGVDRSSRLRRNWATWLRAAAAQPQAGVWAWPLVSRGEQRQLARWNSTAVQLPAWALHTTLHSAIEAQVDRSPNAVAVVFEGQTLSYRELDNQANALAHQLRAVGVAPGRRVGVFLERAPRMVVAMLAIWKAGGAYLPLEPDFPDQRLHSTLQDSTPALVLTTRALCPRIVGHASTWCLDDPALLPPTARTGSSTRPQASAGPADGCYVIYTSGSTGAPKGALLPHRAICNHMAWMTHHHGLTRDDHVLQKTPFSFDASVWEFLAPLLTGARLVLARPGGHRDMPYLALTIQDHQVTTLQLVPSVLQLLVDEPGFARCRSLKRVFCGGEALTTALAQRFAAKLPGVDLINLYGPTECCIDTTTFVCSSSEPGAEATALQTAVQPIGYPVWNTTHHVLDEQHNPVPIGTPGELYIGGVGLALGYLNRPELTAQKFISVEQLGVQGKRLYRTGDRVCLQANGCYSFLGRVDFQVKLNGFRIELGEIEAVLERHPQVAQAVAALREDTPGHRYLAAYVVVRTLGAAGQHLDTTDLAQALRAHLATTLPSHMLPAVCEVLDVLPLTSNGKVDRRALPVPQRLQSLAKRAATPADGLAAGLATAAAEADSISEAALWGLWAELLGTTQFGAEDDFFALGGDSLGLMQLGLALRSRWGIDLPPELLFEATTVRSLAGHLNAALLVQAHGLAPEQTQTHTPTSACGEPLASVEQSSYATAARALRGWPVFNTSEVLHFTRQLPLPVLQQALNAVVARHPALRTQLQHSSGHTVQQVLPAAPVAIQVVQLPGCTAADLQEQLNTAVQQPLDLQNQGPCRWVWLEGGAAGQWLLAVVHHAATDAWSTDLWAQDLLQHCEATLGAGQASLARVPKADATASTTSGLLYAAQQQLRLASGAFEAQRHYWRHTLAGAPAPLQLPTDRARRAIARWQGGRETRLFSPSLRQGLKAVAAQHKASLFMVLLAGFAVVLHEQTGQGDLVVGTSVNNRHGPGLDRLVGCLIGALPLRLRLPVHESADTTQAPDHPLTWQTVLQQARQVCLDAYRHQDLPLGLAFESLPTAGKLAGAPPVPVWLELHDQQHGWAQRFAQLGVQRVDLDRGISESELSVEIDDADSGLLCHAQYKTSLFDAPRVQALLQRYQQLLEALARDPSAPVGLAVRVGQQRC
jgi:amino acid adenylation domain-containing protein